MTLIQGGPRVVGLGAIAVVLLGLGADAPKKTIDARGLTFEVPSSWKSNKPSSNMRRAEIKVDPAKGDENPAELVVFAFPGGAGSVEANIQRWRSQFKDADGNPPKVESKTVKGSNVGVTRVETAGHYYPSQFPGRPKEPDQPNYRLLGAIVQSKTTGYFLKMVGPDKTMKDNRVAFDEMLSSLKLDE